MAKINETNYPRRQASEYASTDMFIVQPVPDPEQEHSGDSRTTRVSDLKEYMLGDADPSKIGTPAAGTYTSASNTNAQNIAALDYALANYDHLTKQIATQAEINGYIADPTTADFNVIYLLKDTSATGSDKYFEYMRLGTPESSTFEMTGDTSTDLSNYFTKAEINAALADKVSKSVTAGLLKNDGTVDTNSYATSAEAFQTNDTAETALDDADYVPFYDTSASVKRKSLWSNIKSVLKTYFDALYIPKLSSATSGNFAGLDSNGNLIDSGSSSSDFIGQFSTMPTATADNYGKVLQYIGATGQDYTHGYFYECKQNGSTYAWVNVPVSEGSGGGHTILDSSGTAMAQRANLQFVGATVSDVSANDATVVNLGTTVSVTHTLSASANTNFDFTGIRADAVITEILATDGRGYVSREYINSGTGIRFVFAPDSSTPSVTLQIRYR